MLELFNGQLTIKDIQGLTFKELGYMRKHRESLKQQKLTSSDNITNALSGLV